MTIALAVIILIALALAWLNERRADNTMSREWQVEILPDHEKAARRWM